MIISVQTLANAINEKRYIKPEEIAKDNNIKLYNNCKVYHTGLYKPHTIEIDNNIRISIVYYSKDNIQGKLIAIAADNNNNQYDIYKTVNVYGNTGYLAFPVNPEKIKGFYPWL